MPNLIPSEPGRPELDVEVEQHAGRQALEDQSQTQLSLEIAAGQNALANQQARLEQEQAAGAKAAATQFKP